jgi:GAF domain-containing protein
LKNSGGMLKIPVEISGPVMKETTVKELQQLGGFVLAGGCSKRMKQVAQMIRAAREYRWVGIYKVTKKEFVIMAASDDEPPAYPRFPITQGLCGAALETRKPLVVGDVRKDSRYLPTFHTTRSEIIIPMMNGHGHIVGMLDAESEKVDAFGEEDQEFLQRAAGLIAHCIV